MLPWMHAPTGAMTPGMMACVLVGAFNLAVCIKWRQEHNYLFAWYHAGLAFLILFMGLLP